MAGYSGTPLVKKLGIKPASRLALISPPDGFTRLLEGLPADVQIATRVSPASDLTIWFVAAGRDLDRRVAAVAAGMGGGLWIAWPKKASGMKTDLTGNAVRDAGLAHGLVDFKVCAIDGTWSGLRFARRKRLPAK
jgi:hypothetical protein